MPAPRVPSLGWSRLRRLRMVIPSHVAYRAFAYETVLLNLNTGIYHSVDEVGARFFEVLLAAPSLQDAVQTLAEEYGQPPERITGDLLDFLDKLRERELVELKEPDR